MKPISLFLIFFLFLVTTSFGQDISRHEADSMIKVLNKTKPGIDRIDLLLSLAQFHIFKPGESQIDFDSATVYINEAKELNRNVNSSTADGYLLLTESYLIKEKGPKAETAPFFRSDEGKKMVETAIKILESGTHKGYLGRAYYELSMYYDYNDSLQLSKKIVLVQQSIDAFQQAGDLKRKGMSLEMLGDLYTAEDEDKGYAKAIPQLKQALAAYDSVKYPKLQGVYVLLGAAYLDQNVYGPALFYLLKALKTANLMKDTSMQLCQINNQLGILYDNIDMLDKSTKYLNDALKIAQKYNDENAIFFLAINLSSTYNYLEKPDQSLKVLGYISKKYRLSDNPVEKVLLNTSYLRTYLTLKQLSNAYPYCDILLDLANKKLDTKQRQCNIYRYVATYYFLTNQYSKARVYLMKSFDVARSINWEYGQIQNLELLHRLDSAQGNFRSAYNHLQLYKEKTDSVNSEKKVRRLQVISIEYEVELKEDSIKLKDKDISLLIQRNNLQQANLRQASLIKNVTIAVIILAFIVIGLLYRQYSHKQKSNQVITQQNEQLQHLLAEKDWLVKEIHHRVKNNLQIVISLLNAQTEFLTHPSAIDAIRESRARMQAIAIIHQKLYQLDNSTAVNMRSYINELLYHIKNSFDDSERILFKVDVADVCLEISQSVPLGLILNETITNAVKYAYPKNEKGLIQISLKHHYPDKLQLKIADNGKGLPADVDTEYSNSLGMQLIRLFSEQLDGDLYFINNNGLEITLNFKSSENKI